jgi:UDP:flavonoid glycosyltransferase YjiC (YdhE family)
MRVLLSTYGGRGDVEPLVGLAVRLRALGAEVRVCAPPDCAERLAEVGVPLVPVGQPVRPLVHGATPPSAADVPRRAAELIAAQFDKLAPAAEGCDALVATGLMPAAAGARSGGRIAVVEGRDLPPLRQAIGAVIDVSAQPVQRAHAEVGPDETLQEAEHRQNGEDNQLV